MWVSTEEGVYCCDNVVVTVPLGVLQVRAWPVAPRVHSDLSIVAPHFACRLVLQARKIAFDPPLSPPRLGAIDRLGMATLNKVVLIFEERWWADSPLGTGNYFMSAASPRDGKLALWVDFSTQLGTPVLVGLEGGARSVESEVRCSEATS